MIFKVSRKKTLSKYQVHIFFILIILVVFTYYDYLIVLFSGLLIWSLIEDRGLIANLLSNNIIYKLGLWSYSIYLLHPILIGAFKDYIYDLIKQTSIALYAFPISLVSSVGLTICLSILTYKYIEIPGKKNFQDNIVTMLIIEKYLETYRDYL